MLPKKHYYSDIPFLFDFITFVTNLSYKEPPARFYGWVLKPIPKPFSLWPYSITFLLQALSLFIFLLLIVAFFTLMERQLIASIQRRQGPNVIGIFGLLQPIADGVKLLTKEFIIPNQSNAILFLISPLIVFICSFMQWCQLPVTDTIVATNTYSILNGTQSNTLSYVNLSLLYMGAFGSIGSIGIFLAGWASNSKYALLGALRSIAQIISYELALSTVFLCIGAYTNTINFDELVVLQAKTTLLIFPLLSLWLIFFIITLAETNRAPFDLPEGESEIVAGFNVEYSGIMFALFFLGEYGKILAVSAIHIIVFFGGWYIGIISYHTAMVILFYGFKILCLSYLFIVVRAILPRYRVDQVTYLGYYVLLPIAFGLFLIAVIMTLFF